MKTTIIIGDAIEKLRGIPDNSVDCVVTSPPYYGLRDYGMGGQIGLEETPAQFIQKLVEVFREVHRALKPSGSCWINIGDSYASYRDGKATPDSMRNADNGTLVPKGSARNRSASTFTGTSIKHKNLIGIPWRLAFALQDDGWNLRQDIIWSKPNPMPESVRDRCTKAHEYIFLMTKSPTYYFDSSAIKENSVRAGDGNSWEERKAGGAPARHGLDGASGHNDGDFATGDHRNKRSVWEVATESFKDAHFATYPTKLIEPCILAGCPAGGIVLDPFFGAGTTGIVAHRHGRNCIGIELNPQYAGIAINRLRNDCGMFSDIEVIA